MIPEKIKDICEEIGLNPREAAWELPQRKGTWIVKHKALERIAAHKGVKFDLPTIIESNANDKMCVILVNGHLGDAQEWSIGEASSYNNKNNYPFAMAEKRAKDRVILKLVGLHGDAYSEEEADDFKESAPAPVQAIEKPQTAIVVDDWKGIKIHFSKHEGKTLGELTEKQLTWWQNNYDPVRDGNKPSHDDLILREALNKSKRVGGKKDGFGF